MNFKISFSARISFWSFISGCFPVAIINFIINYKIENLLSGFFAYLFIFFSSFATVYLVSVLRGYVKNIKTNVGCNNAKISNIKRKNLFTTGAMGYYVIPFVSFIGTGDNYVSTVILLILIILFAWLFTANRMVLYNPMLDILGYRILEATVSISGKEHTSDILTKAKDAANLYFSSVNNVSTIKIDETTYFARLSNPTLQALEES